MGPTGIYLIFGKNGVQSGGIYIKPADMPGPANWLPYAHVPDADKGFALATSNGARKGWPRHGCTGGQPHRSDLRSDRCCLCNSLDAGRASGD